jgi:hypothetical protein
LLVHEYRHVVQVDKLNQGFTRGLGWIFGQQAVGAVLGLYLPLWFLEGDAVVSETERSLAGRGRNPAFAAPLKAQLAQYGAYTYEKAYFGSYRDYVPNHYILGYHLVAPARLRFGTDIWSRAINRSARRPWSIAPMSLSLKQSTGMGMRQWYREALSVTDSIWKSNTSPANAGAHLVAVPAATSWTSYRRPHRLPDGNIVAERSSLDAIDAIVRLHSDGKEEILHRPGTWFRTSLSAGGSLLAWTERRPHPRWENKAWSEIWTLDLLSGKVRRLTPKSRLFSPALDREGKRILAVEIGEDNSSRLVIVNALSGEIRVLDTPQGIAHIMQPGWHPDGNAVVFITQDSLGRKGLAYFSPGQSTLHYLIPPGYEDIGNPSAGTRRVHFTGTYGDNFALFSIDLITNERRLEASGDYGITDARIAPGDAFLLGSALTADGYRPARIPTANLLSQEMDQPARPWMDIADTLSLQAQVPELPLSADYTATRYRRLPNLFNIHSWGPIAVNTDGRSASPGISILSHNLLSTSFLEAGYQYLSEESRGEWYAEYRYEGWFPRLVVEARTGHRTAVAPDLQGELLAYGWREYRFRAGLDLPLRAVRGPYFLGALPSAYLSHTLLEMDDDSPFRFRDNTVQSLDQRLFLYRIRKQSHRDLQYRWGQIIEFNTRNVPWEKELGSIRSAEAMVYTPGLLPHHGLRWYGGYQQREGGQYLFTGLVRIPTGWTGHAEPRIWSTALDYILPLWMPDLNISGLAYIKRFSGGLFWEYARGENTISGIDYQSYGAELRMEAHFFRFLAPVNLGYRIYRKHGFDQISGSLFMSFDFNALSGNSTSQERMTKAPESL